MGEQAEETRKIVKIDIDDICMASYPCLHGVEVTFEDGEVQHMSMVSARNIIYMCESNKLPIDPHFNYLRRKENIHCFKFNIHNSIDS
jgi:hypothetical protein